MTNLEKYKKTYTESLSLSLDFKVEDLEYNAIPEWDSIGHMTLVSAIEDEFDIMLDAEDFQKATTISDLYDLVMEKANA